MPPDLRFGTRLILAQLARKGADEVGAPARNFDDSIEVEEHERLSCKEVTPEIEDRDRVGVDQFPVRFTARRQERQGVVSRRESAEAVEPSGVLMFCITTRGR
jgi:hypothetical protein